MEGLLDTPLVFRLAVVFVASAFVATLLNAAIYAWSWAPRLVSPWQKTAEGVAPRGWLDRLPVVGWLWLRRDSAVLGRRFWVRPLGIELGFAAGLAALYWWEVDRLGLIAPQVEELFRAAGVAPPAVHAASLAWPLHCQFFCHAVLAALMTIATFIDFDERIIPDQVTTPGTLAGLILATLAPLCLLPSVQPRMQPPVAGQALMIDAGGEPVPMIAPGGAGRVYLEPTHPAAPGRVAQWQQGRPNRFSLLVGLGCFGLWCLALTDRHWPCRGPWFRRVDDKLKLVLARVRRDLSNSPLRETLAAGLLLVGIVWLIGGRHWQGLLTSLVGMVGGGLVVWAVRIIGSAVLRREAMGFGDVTLMMMVGAFIGWQPCPLIFFFAPVAGIFLALVNLLLRGDKAIPFGPFLCLATVVVLVGWGPVWARGQILYGVGWLVPAVLVVCFVLLGVLLGLLQLLKAALGIKGED
ncbi:MAG: A24 family peptidase [Planctomycetota bacterium]